MNSALNCFTIAAEQPFITHLASWVLKEYGANAALLTKILILLPNRRACRTLREAFLEVSGGKPMLLPRIQPLGDVEDSPLNSGDTPPISLLRRQLLLTRLVLGFKGLNYNIEQAAELASHLAEFIDDATREGVSFDRLTHLVPEELAAHWQQTLDFLSVVSHHWPKILQAEEAHDPVEHRNRVLQTLAKTWQSVAPPYPIIAAGSTGSQPATAQLLSVIARLPQGRVVLPGLDTGMPESEWKHLSETHPQWGMKQLLEGMGVRKEDVGMWRGGDVEKQGSYHLHISTPPHRLSALRAIFAPAEATAHWMKSELSIAQGFAGLRLLTADTLLDEARMIAITLRQALETPGKTAALVTPDRSLARMVMAQMQRFGIAINDSAGQPLKEMPPTVFMRLVADMAATAAAPAALLALLRHPFAAAGVAPAECRRLSRLLELQLLRGVRHASGLRSLADAAQDGALQNWLTHIANQAQPLLDCFQKTAVPLKTILSAHMQLAEWLAGETGLWARDDGNQLAEFLAELLEQADLLERIDPITYPGLFDTLLAGQTFRPRYGLHPRLHILSPMEARLQRFDLVILGGLNEGVWPENSAANPWMSRPMRKAFGLPAPERAIGQSAHDVFMLACAPEVILSRARKVEGTPTVPSRWLVRLQTFIGGKDAGYLQAMRMEEELEKGKDLLDAALPISPIGRPMPTPPLAARPRQLHVTAIDTWLRDPYVIYAKYILKLHALEPLDKEPNAADFGTLIHRALECFIHDYPQALPDNAYKLLLEYGREAFANVIDRPAVATLWWPRFESMAAWLLAQEKQRRPALARVLSELKGTWPFAVDGKPFTLTTRIDRMEVGHNGELTLIDYKTGAIPSKSDIERGLANQLLLEALLVQEGQLTPSPAKRQRVGEGGLQHNEYHSSGEAPTLTLPPLGRGNISSLEYWKLAGHVEDCEIKSVNPDTMHATQQRLEALIRHFNDPRTPYAPPSDPSLILHFNDYAHLTRRDEWEAV